MEVIIAPKACSDIEAILEWTHENFGPQIVENYAKLIETAISAVAENPDCPGSTERSEIAENCRTYHLFHARKKASADGLAFPVASRHDETTIRSRPTAAINPS
jgi:plasmid stabilization system protein ParE